MCIRDRFATVVLGYMETIAHEVLKDEALAAEAASLKKEIHDAIESMAIVDNYYYGKVYAYEVDGYGQYTVSYTHLSSTLWISFCRDTGKFSFISMYSSLLRYFYSAGFFPVCQDIKNSYSIPFFLTLQFPRALPNGAVDCSTCPVFKTMLKSIHYDSQNPFHYSRSKTRQGHLL